MNIMELAEYNGRPFNDLEFVANINGRYYYMQYPITTLSPGYDYQIIAIPHGKNGWIMDKARTMYFNFDHNFDFIM